MRGGWRRRFDARGVFWRRGLQWGVRNIPPWLEPVVIGTWALLFLTWRPGRRAVMANLAAIFSGSSFLLNFLRTYRVFWNFGWTLTDNARFKELHAVPDWEFRGLEHFEELRSREDGAIVLTAHMGSYDLGAHLFAEICGRQLTMVRAPEADPETQEWEKGLHERTAGDAVRVGFSTSNLAFDLLDAIQRGEIVAIQGDRVPAGVASARVSFFGMDTRFPSGPFALAMAARVPIYPLFVIRAGRRRYRLQAAPPFMLQRTSADRDRDVQEAVERWAATLQDVVSESWHQWFAFDPFAEKRA